MVIVSLYNLYSPVYTQLTTSDIVGWLKGKVALVTTSGLEKELHTAIEMSP